MLPPSLSAIALRATDAVNKAVVSKPGVSQLKQACPRRANAALYSLLGSGCGSATSSWGQAPLGAFCLASSSLADGLDEAAWSYRPATSCCGSGRRCDLCVMGWSTASLTRSRTASSGATSTRQQPPSPELGLPQVLVLTIELALLKKLENIPQPGLATYFSNSSATGAQPLASFKTTSSQAACSVRQLLQAPDRVL